MSDSQLGARVAESSRDVTVRPYPTQPCAFCGQRKARVAELPT